MKALEPDFNPLVVEAISRAGKSEDDLARAIGVSQAWINKLKKGAPVSADLAVRLERAVGIPRWRWRPDLWSEPASERCA